MHIKQQKFFLSRQVLIISTGDRKNFCCFRPISVNYGLTRCYKSTVIEKFILAVFLLNLFNRCILSHKPI